MFLGTCLLTLGITPAIIRFLSAHTILDIPNARSSHDLPIPRGGGLAILAVYLIVNVCLIVTGWLGPGRTWLALTPPLFAMAVLGFLDDLYSLRISTRILAQAAAAAWAVWLGHLGRPTLQLPWLPPVELGAAGAALSWLWLVGFTNLFNFMDGINGLAGFQATLASLALAVLAGVGGDPGFTLLSVALAGSSLGFLRHNFPTARVFLGDVGSMPLGFFLAFGVLHAARIVPGQHPFVLTTLVVWPFLFDGAFTLARRAVRRQRLGDAHRDHLYQLLVRAGCSHRAVTAMYAAVIVVCAAFAVAVRVTGATRAAAGFYGVALLSLVAAGLVLRFHRRRTAGTQAGRSAGSAAAGTVANAVPATDDITAQDPPITAEAEAEALLLPRRLP